MARKKNASQDPPQQKPCNDSSAPSQPSPDGPASPEQFPVVAIGASAGGLEAFKRFFPNMPPDSGMAFVLIPHLDPSHESMMVSLISRYTTMPVVEAAEGLRLKPNNVYVLPPNKYMGLTDGTLHLTGPVQRSGPQTSIDLFLRCLAESHQEQAIGIVLSGTGAHGSLGLKAIKAQGGLAIVQDPATAGYDQMPRNAIGTGAADFVVAPEEMANVLLRYRQQFLGHPHGASLEGDDQLANLNQIFALLRTRLKYDFRHYRKRMLMRRIERRMSLNGVEGIGAYVELLRNRPEEVKALTKDLLISVTSFFRDPEVFHTLATEVIPGLVERKDPDGVIRVWVPGCATGEEAYSIAMLLMEHVSESKKNCRIQVFASDLDADAVQVGRQGHYPDTIVADVSPERLHHFFTRFDDTTYQVNKTLREAVVFATQNLISDVPFSKLDLISCRNVLIYLEPELQKKIIAMLHFALLDGGYLLLGPSETIGRQTDLFEPVSKKWRIYRRIGPSRPERVDFPVGFTAHHHGDLSPLSRRATYAELAQNTLLDDFAPAAVLINRRYEVLYYHGPTGLYLNMPAGEPTQDLLRLAREGLATKLRASIHKAAREEKEVSVGRVRMRRSGGTALVQVSVKPVRLTGGNEMLLLVTFRDERRLADEGARESEVAADSLENELESELRAAREELQQTIEELETYNEELKSSNEEVMSMNEELQSANEELETSKEELQSLNEELSTVNVQLHEKVTELEATNNDLANLFSSTGIATIFLDTDLRIKRFSPASTALFNLLASDVGRPISDIAPKFVDGDMMQDIAQVLRSLMPSEREVPTHDSRWCLRRALPYRTHDNKIEGVVVTFTDITEFKRAAEQQRRLATLLMDSNDAVFVSEPSGRITAWNRGAERMYGYSEAKALSLQVDRLVPPERREEYEAVLKRVAAGEKVSGWETQRVTKDGRTVDVSITLTGMRDESGTLVAVMATERDVTERKESEAQLREQWAVLEQRVKERTAELRTGNEMLNAEMAERRALERQLLEVATGEQLRIGQDLHDSVGQELTALGLLAESLVERHPDPNPPEAATVRKIAAGVRRALKHVRALSRGLVPVEVDAEGLMAALTDLCTQTNELSRVRCRFTCDDPVLVEDNATATQLFAIVKEAVTNALRHAEAKNIDIALRSEDSKVVLVVRDDGIGLRELADTSAGMGLKIMKHRAAIINASLSVEPADGRGTQVTCAFMQGEKS